jgi:hypothetical protein
LRTSRHSLELLSQLDTRLTTYKLSDKSWNLPAEIGTRPTNAEIDSAALQVFSTFRLVYLFELSCLVMR